VTDSYEQERFYRRANTAVDVAEAVAYGVLAKSLWDMGAAERAARKAKYGPTPGPVQAWLWTMAGFFGLAVVAFLIEAGSQDIDDYDSSPGYGWSIFFLVLAVLCFLGAIVHCCFIDYENRKYGTPQAPPPARPPTPRDWPPRPVAPAPTQTRVERSVRVVRATSATTTHHDSQAPVAALESPHKDVAPSTDLVVIRQSHRPTLWTEDHGSYTSKDRRSFDRDIGPV